MLDGVDNSDDAIDSDCHW